MHAEQHGRVLWTGQGRQGSTQRCPPSKQLSLEPKDSKEGCPAQLSGLTSSSTVG